MKYQEESHLVQLVHVYGLIHKRSRLPWGIPSWTMHSKGEELGAQVWQVSREDATKKKKKKAKERAGRTRRV